MNPSVFASRRARRHHTPSQWDALFPSEHRPPSRPRLGWVTCENGSSSRHPRCVRDKDKHPTRLVSFPENALLPTCSGQLCVGARGASPELCTPGTGAERRQKKPRPPKPKDPTRRSAVRRKISAVRKETARRFEGRARSYSSIRARLPPVTHSEDPTPRVVFEARR